MDNIIKNIKIADFCGSKFVKPFRLKYEMKGEARYWDCVDTHDSVSALIYHTQKEAFLFVKQFRPSVWFWESKNIVRDGGFTYELCAGIMDKGLDIKSTMIEEIVEETGYKPKEICYITSCFSGLGFAASKQSLFYANIDESMKVGDGGGVDGECIQSIFVPKNQMMEFIYDESKVIATSTLFAALWFDKHVEKL